MAARTCAGMARFIGIRALPGHSIADEIHKVAEDSYCAEQQEPRRGLLVHALNEFHLSAFCANSASRRITHGKVGTSNQHVWQQKVPPMGARLAQTTWQCNSPFDDPGRCWNRPPPLLRNRSGGSIVRSVSCRSAPSCGNVMRAWVAPDFRRGARVFPTSICSRRI